MFKVKDQENLTNRAYFIELDPTCAQVVLFKKHAGASRFIYNKALELKKWQYEQFGTSFSYIELCKYFTEMRNDSDFKWMKEVSSQLIQQTCRNLDQAFQDFFRRAKNGEKNVGYPLFKSRNKTPASFRLPQNGFTKVINYHINLPFIGKVKLKYDGYVPEGIKILSVTISEKSGHWFASVNTEAPKTTLADKSHLPILGVDVGVKKLATTSEKQVFENYKRTKKYAERLKLRNQALARKVKGSNNYNKEKLKVQKVHYKIACSRKDSIHKMTHAITKSASVVVVETLNVEGMKQNRTLSKSVSDASFYEIHRQLQYKCEREGIVFFKTPQFFPSSKTCSCCGFVKNTLTLKERTFECESCGINLDRDLNAALNLKQFYVSYFNPRVVGASLSSSGSLTDLGKNLLTSVDEAKAFIH